MSHTYTRINPTTLEITQDGYSLGFIARFTYHTPYSGAPYTVWKASVDNCTWSKKSFEYRREAREWLESV